MEGHTFNPPPGWPKPPESWRPPLGWEPPSNWPAMPAGWTLWTPIAAERSIVPAPTDIASISRSEDISQRGGTAADDELKRLRIENQSLRDELARSSADRTESVSLDDSLVLQSVGIYRYHHPLEDAAAFQEGLLSIEEGIKRVISSGSAIESSSLFTFNNSLAQGRKMRMDLGKLMLRAYNAEADNCLRALRVGNAITAKGRLERSRAAIAKLGSMMEMRIGQEFHDLRIQEIELTSDWLMKKQEEKEAAREVRAQLREEKRVEKELADERARLEKERAHLLNALSAIQGTGSNADALQIRLNEVEDAIVHNDFRAANIRAGYVYVISNRGAFGEGVVKIGLTRRLEPADRIAELSGASVPFKFDVHALFFSEDAVSLENELHHHFAGRALNRANARKEFFFASPGEVRDVLLSKVGNILEFREDADATEYHQSVSDWPLK